MPFLAHEHGHIRRRHPVHRVQVGAELQSITCRGIRPAERQTVDARPANGCGVSDTGQTIMCPEVSAGAKSHQCLDVACLSTALADGTSVRSDYLGSFDLQHWDAHRAITKDRTATGPRSQQPRLHGRVAISPHSPPTLPPAARRDGTRSGVRRRYLAALTECRYSQRCHYKSSGISFASGLATGQQSRTGWRAASLAKPDADWPAPFSSQRPSFPHRH